MADTPYGESDFFGAVAYLIGATGMLFTFTAILILTVAATQQARKG